MIFVWKSVSDLNLLNNYYSLQVQLYLRVRFLSVWLKSFSFVSILSPNSGFRVRPVSSGWCHGSHALRVSDVHGTFVILLLLLCVTGIVVGFLICSYSLFGFAICVDFGFVFLLLKGSWSDHVTSIWCQGGSMEFGYNRIPVSDRTGTLHGSDSTGIKNVLRTEP